MGEIGAMMARLEQEGLNIEELINYELEAAGFLSLAARSTDSLSDRIDAISGNQSELKCLFKSIEDQLRVVQEEENIPESLLDDKMFVDNDAGVKHVIVIDDDDDIPKSDFNGQVDLEPSPSHVKTQSQPLSKPTETINSSQPTKPADQIVTSVQSSKTLTTTAKTTTPAISSPAPLRNSEATQLSSKPEDIPQYKRPDTLKTTPVSTAQDTPHNTPLNTPIDTPESVIAYRTLRSPSEDGPDKAIVSITVKSSQPVIPPQHLRGAAVPTTPSIDVEPAAQASNNTAPKFDEGTRIIGKRSDDLWYPGQIIKVITDRYNQNKFRVKFDQGNRGLLRSNHVALETSAPRDVLNIGSRVVGPYGKLDVLYAGIVAEKCCPETRNRFLIFFDDGFAQYLPLQKLHHVCNTGDKVWNEVAEHSQEFIQEYLEEFPNRPMVVLKVNQWVKTEWRGKWLKAKVLQVDCSLVKMLFQVDNRTEWIYRGSTRLEPLFKALIDGKISKKKSSKRPKKQSQAPDEPYVDFSVTNPAFGYSPYSKTDSKGPQQQPQQKDTTSAGQPSSSTQTETSQPSSSKTQEKPTSTATTSTTTTTQTTTTQIPLTPTSKSSTQQPSNSVSSNQTSATSTTPSLAPSQAPSSNTLAVRTLRRLANKVNDGNISPSKTTDSVKKTPPELKTNRIVSPSANTDSYFFPNSAVNTSYTTNIRSNNILPNHISPVNHMSGVNHLDDSNASIIASTMRKRTTAGLNTVNIGHVLTIGPDVIIPGHHNGITPSLGKSPKKKWEAPWKTHSDTNILKEPNMKVKEQNSKHDAATLIQERLQAEKKLVKTLKTMPELQSLVPKFPVLGPHQCAKPCGKVETISKKEQSKHNMLALPLLLNWKREIAKRHPRIKREIYYRAPCNKRLKSIEDVAKYLLLTGTSNVAIDQFSFDPDIACTDVMVHSESIVIPDISLGEESVPISVMNEHDKSLPPSIDYVHDRILSDGVHINTDPGFLACCDCTDNCQDKTKCSCAQLTISASAAVDGKVDNTVGYEYRRLMDTVPTGIYECNQNCACSSQCFNRVVQNGIQLRLQVFKTENRGWGLRTLDDIPVGTFICTYSGQIMNEDMANKEGRDFGDEYLAELDHIEVVEKIKEGYESSVSDQEDDSVILKTLQTGHSTSDLSENGSPCGSFTSESDSDDSDSSHSSYSPRVKKNGHSKRKSPEPVKITEEDGTTFSITMADEKCVMAISSGDSIVLKRIGGPDDVKQENNTVKPKEEVSNKIDLQKDPPPMPKPTIIDLTSDDEDNCLIKCSLNETEPDRTFESKTMNKSTEEQNTKDTGSKKFTDFKFFNISSENANGGDADGDVTKGDIRNDVKVESVEGTKGAGSSDVISSNMDIKDSETIDKKTELETAVEMLMDQNITLKEADNSSPSHVTCSVSEVTKQEEMEIDPCMREQSQELSEEKMDTSASHVPEKQPISDSVRDNDRQDVKDSIKDKPTLQGNSCLSDGGSNQDKNCGKNSCLDNEESLQTSKICIQGSENDKAGDVNHHHSDEKDYYGNRNSDNHDNNKNDTLIEDDKFKDGNLGNVDSIHGNKESIATKESQEEHGVDNDCGVDFELRMEIDESMDSIDGKESDTQSDRLSGKSFNFSKTPAPSDDDSVPPLMSADDLSKIAAQIHLADEEPPKLTKMQPGSRLTGDLHDTIAKLQSRGVALNNTGPDVPEEDSTQSFDDLPLFPSTSSCDSFPASPASSHSGSWVSDSVDRSSDGSCEQKARRDRLKNDGRRARRFIVTLQKSGVKRSASPDGIEGGPQKRPSTRSLFNGEEHCYVIDAKAYGNCGRYLNHSCSPNLFVQNVFIDTHDLRFPRVAFFAQHNIRAGCELTWDYMYEVGSVQDKFLRCYCGSSQCRGRLL